MAAKKRFKRIAVLTGGGDCPGLNAVIRAVTKTAITRYGAEVWGIEDGFLGLIENRMSPLSYEQVSNLLTVGGTILGSCNKSNPLPSCPKPVSVSSKDVSEVSSAPADKGEALVCIGGDGTVASAADLPKSLPVMGVPKTIDNDVWGTDVTFDSIGGDYATEAIDKVHTAASSHHRVMIVEVMGRCRLDCVMRALPAGDVILIPEMDYELDTIAVCPRPSHKANASASLPWPREPNPKAANRSWPKFSKTVPTRFVWAVSVRFWPNSWKNGPVCRVGR